MRSQRDKTLVFLLSKGKVLSHISDKFLFLEFVVLILLSLFYIFFCGV